MTGSAHGGPADDNDVGGVFRVCVGVEESARSAPLMWGVFDEPLTDHDLLVLSRAFDFSDGLREHCVPAAWEALDSTLDSGVRELVSHPPRTEAELAAAIAVLLQCLFDRFGSVFPQCGLMVFPGVVIVSR